MRSELETLDLDAVRSRARAAGLEAICGCDPAYPPGLRGAGRPAGGAPRRRRPRALGRDCSSGDPVAIVGSRRASAYGLDVARSLGRGLAVAGHDGRERHGARDRLGRPRRRARGGAADGRGAAGRGRPSLPAGQARAHRRIVAGGAAVSELAPGTAVRRWMFPARNRIIAALAAMTVVVEAGERSGALVTARLARGIGRAGGRRARAGHHAAGGRARTACWPPARASCAGRRTCSITLFGAGERTAREPRRQPPAELAPLLAAIARGPRDRRGAGPRGVRARPRAGGAGGARARRVRAARRRAVASRCLP